MVAFPVLTTARYGAAPEAEQRSDKLVAQAGGDFRNVLYGSLQKGTSSLNPDAGAHKQQIRSCTYPETETQPIQALHEGDGRVSNASGKHVLRGLVTQYEF